MKIPTSLTAIILFILAAFHAQGELSPFMERVNADWRARNYDDILQLATVGAAKSPPDPEALSVLFAYHIFISGDQPKASQALDRLSEFLREKGDPGGAAVVKELRADMEKGSGKVTPLSAQQMEQIRKENPDSFPVAMLWPAVPSLMFPMANAAAGGPKPTPTATPIPSITPPSTHTFAVTPSPTKAQTPASTPTIAVAAPAQLPKWPFVVVILALAAAGAAVFARRR